MTCLEEKKIKQTILINTTHFAILIINLSKKTRSLCDHQLFPKNKKHNVCRGVYLGSQWFVFFLQIFELLLQRVQGEKHWSWHTGFTEMHPGGRNMRNNEDFYSIKVLSSAVWSVMCFLFMWFILIWSRRKLRRQSDWNKTYGVPVAESPSLSSAALV